MADFQRKSALLTSILQPQDVHHCTFLYCTNDQDKSYKTGTYLFDSSCIILVENKKLAETAVSSKGVTITSKLPKQVTVNLKISWIPLLFNLSTETINYVWDTSRPTASTRELLFGNHGNHSRTPSKAGVWDMFRVPFWCETVVG